MVSELLYGGLLIAAMCAMIWIARPPQGADSAPWLRIYIVGQLYVMTAMLCGIVGVSLLIQNWP